MTRTDRPSLERIAHAATVIDPVFLDSPQYLAESLSQQLGCRLVVKVETVNPIRSFKGRGADYLVASLEGRPHLVCATAGNFGQGMAYAARKRGIPLTMFAAATANPLKVERMRALGAEVQLVGEDYDAAHRAARAFAQENPTTLLVEDGRDIAIAEGAGTIGLELLRWPTPFDAMLIPLGDGSLLGGIACWVKGHHPATRVFGVCASQAPTIADGLAVRAPYPEILDNLEDLVDEIFVVDDDPLVTAMRLAHAELGVVLEPAGAAGLAALQLEHGRFEGQQVAAILTGGNVTVEQIGRWFGP